MNRIASMETLALTLEPSLVARCEERSATLPSAQYTADMVQRTTDSTAEAESMDYLAVARMARDMRSQCVANLLGRASKALAIRFGRLAPPSIGRAP
jgi:hypothetical protein